ncbi:hypothetical protein JCM19314_1278 [Nonlabens ulvanivorans]|uniref:Uncharacterized protein n=1 Tax=Nonlabens ulvanivorans TaxID=906888 RepID=A0A090QEI6_NONUL|nr:hypothetical protein [Nonlabens ulvanivorans]GAL01495.1 hypothetical protein JCM19314_1278 [Nonlabens ulvanivorans]
MKFKITLLLLLVTLVSNAQKLEEEVLDKLSNSICTHLKEEGDIDNLTSVEALKVFTESMFKAYATDPEYYKENGLDFTAGDEVLEAYGEQLGMHMVVNCPSSISLFLSMAGDEDFEEMGYTSESVPMTFNLTGKVVDFSNEQFYTINIKDETGRVRKFLWLEYVENDHLLEIAMKKKKKYTFTYVEKNMYDLRIQEYRNMLVLTKIEE